MPPTPLLKFLELKQGEFFNQGESNKDVTTLIDLYGSQGHVFADVQADLRFLEEPGTLDVAYRIKEGEVFKVSEINVHIGGEFPHTKQTVVLNNVALRPGDIIDTRDVRNSERRLKASSSLPAPKTTANHRELSSARPTFPRWGVWRPATPRTQTVRGQEPDPIGDGFTRLPPQQQPSIYSWEPQLPPGPAYPPPPLLRRPPAYP